MNDKPVIKVVPSKLEAKAQNENMQEWIKVFEELSDFSKTTSDGPFKIKVFYDPSYLRGYSPNIEKSAMSDDETEDKTMFGVACGEGVYESSNKFFNSDMQFRFCPNYCAIWTWWDAASHGDSDQFDKLVKSLLQNVEVSNIKDIESGTPIELSGSADVDRVTLNDGLLILKHWIVLLTPLMKKEKPKK